jgi:predicted ester cyclase
MSDSSTAIQSYIDRVWIGRDPEAVAELVSEDFVRHGPEWEGGDTHGPEAMKQALTGFLAIFPDLTQEIVEQDIRGDKGYLRLKTSGTHTGAPLLGVEPSGTRVEFPCLWEIRAQDGKVAEEWVAYDSLYVMMRIGVVSLPAGA